MVPHGPECVQKSCFCHFPSSAAAITRLPSAVLIHCDRATLCLLTVFNRSSPHLHCEDGRKERDYGGKDGKRLGRGMKQKKQKEQFDL